ncbi:hypothetical protein O181_036944 [Austropuccinia psidii MF-1]|uniref:Uncharacterized protein n=1 Tax=Austropuccinia psidii MF-1 TaxID=1389203 RepID=A0A9Q3HC16_9BASI|nr:hypothetical protein [Austropuccinia psidii MF-1]
MFRMRRLIILNRWPWILKFLMISSIQVFRFLEFNGRGPPINPLSHGPQPLSMTLPSLDDLQSAGPVTPHYDFAPEPALAHTPTPGDFQSQPVTMTRTSFNNPQLPGQATDSYGFASEPAFRHAPSLGHFQPQPLNFRPINLHSSPFGPHSQQKVQTFAIQNFDLDGGASSTIFQLGHPANQHIQCSILTPFSSMLYFHRPQHQQPVGPTVQNDVETLQSTQDFYAGPSIPSNAQAPTGLTRIGPLKAQKGKNKRESTQNPNEPSTSKGRKGPVRSIEDFMQSNSHKLQKDLKDKIPEYYYLWMAKLQKFPQPLAARFTSPIESNSVLAAEKLRDHLISQLPQNLAWQDPSQTLRTNLRNILICIANMNFHILEVLNPEAQPEQVGIEFQKLHFFLTTSLQITINKASRQVQKDDNLIFREEERCLLAYLGFPIFHLQKSPMPIEALAQAYQDSTKPLITKICIKYLQAYYIDQNSMKFAIVFGEGLGFSAFLFKLRLLRKLNSSYGVSWRRLINDKLASGKLIPWEDNLVTKNHLKFMGEILRYFTRHQKLTFGRKMTPAESKLFDIWKDTDKNLVIPRGKNRSHPN